MVTKERATGEENSEVEYGSLFHSLDDESSRTNVFLLTHQMLLIFHCHAGIKTQLKNPKQGNPESNIRKRRGEKRIHRQIIRRAANEWRMALCPAE